MKLSTFIIVLSAGALALLAPPRLGAQTSTIAPGTTMPLRAIPSGNHKVTTTTLLESNVARRMELYRRANIASEKLPQLENLHRELFAARLNNETTRTAELRRRLNEILTNDEQNAFEREVRKSTQRLREQLAIQRTGFSTATLTANPPAITAPSPTPTPTPEPRSRSSR